MIRSMTGFGTAEGLVGGLRVSVDIRTVNHRFFSPAIKLPPDLARWEPDVRETLRKRIARGHVTLATRTERVTAPLVVDEARFAAHVELLRGLKDRHRLSGDIAVTTILRMPDVVSASEEKEEGNASELVAVVDAAVDVLMDARGAEGERLAAVLLERLSVIESALERIGERAPQRL